MKRGHLRLVVNNELMKEFESEDEEDTDGDGTTYH